MNNLGEVVYALKCHTSDGYAQCSECKYPCREDGTITIPIELAKDALSLLKAQVPRVLSIQEIVGMEMPTPVWIEEAFDDGYWVLVRYNRIIYPERGEQCYFNDGALDGMGVHWRMWTSRPDEKRRAETPWE